MRAKLAIGAAAVVVCLSGVAVASPRHHRAAHAVVTARPAADVTRLSTAARGLHCRLRKRHLRTLPGLRPTATCVAIRAGAAPRGEQILVTPRPDPKVDPGSQFGLMLFSGDGKLLWYDRRPNKVHDLKQVTLGGRPLLAFFERHPGHPFYEFLDDRYRRVLRVSTGHGMPTDEHDLQITPQGTAYLAAEPVVRRRGGLLDDYVVQEIDPASGAVHFQWRALDHVALGDSYLARPRAGIWDYFHGNSIDAPTPTDPTVIVSSRDASSIYGIDRAGGRIRWIFGGKRDQFGLHAHPRWVFCTQHDVHRLPNGDLSVFDNGGSHINGRPRCPVHPARALEFRLDTVHRRARLVRSISSAGLGPGGGGILSQWVGNVAPLANGDTLIDWGDLPRISVIGPGDREDVLLRLQFWSYRAAPARWVGHPAGAPAVVARGGNVWVSWNGATEVRRWQLLGGETRAALKPIGRPVDFADLETHIHVSSPARFEAVEALAADGSVLGRSAAVAMRA